MQAMLKTRKSRDPETSLMPVNLTREEHVGVRGSPEPPGRNKGSAQAPEPAVPEGRGRPAAGPSDVLDLAPAVPRALCVGDTHFAAPPPGRGSLQGRTKKGTRRLSCSPETFARRSPSLSPRWAERRTDKQGRGRWSRDRRPRLRLAGRSRATPRGPGLAPRLRRGWPGGRVLRRPWVRSLWASCHPGRGRGRCFVGVRRLDTLLALSLMSCGTLSVVPRQRAEQL